MGTHPANISRDKTRVRNSNDNSEHDYHQRMSVNEITLDRFPGGLYIARTTPDSSFISTASTGFNICKIRNEGCNTGTGHVVLTKILTPKIMIRGLPLVTYAS